MAKQLTDIFDHRTEGQIRDFEKHLHSRLGKDLAEEIIALASTKTEEKFAAIQGILLVRYKKLNALYDRLEKVKSKEEYQEGIKQFFQLIHPRDVLNDLTRALRFQEIEQDYKKFLKDFSTKPYGELFKRYRWQDDVYRLLQAGILSQSKKVTETLEDHADEIARHIELLKEIKSKSVGKGLLRMGTSIAASLVAGPLGGLAARGLMSVFGGSSQEEVGSSISKVEAKWNEFSETLFQFLDEARVKYYYVLLTLYGGTLIQVSEDLKGFKLKIKELYLIDNHYELEVTDEERKQVLEWAVKNGAELEHALKSRQSNAAWVASDRFYRYFQSHPYCGFIEKEPGTSLMYYANLLKTAAIFQVANQFREENELEKFAEMMERYFVHAPMAVLDEHLQELESETLIKMSLAYLAFCSRRRDDHGLMVLADYFERMIVRSEKGICYPGEVFSTGFESVIVLAAYALQGAGGPPHPLLSRIPKYTFQYGMMRYLSAAYREFEPQPGAQDRFWRMLKKHKRNAFWGKFKKLGRFGKKVWWIPVMAILIAGLVFMSKWLDKDSPSVSRQAEESPQTVTAKPAPMYEVIVDAANVREQPGAAFSVVTVVEKGAQLRYLEEQQTVGSAVWIKVEAPDGQHGWINSKLLKKK